MWEYTSLLINMAFTFCQRQYTEINWSHDKAAGNWLCIKMPVTFISIIFQDILRVSFLLKAKSAIFYWWLFIILIRNMNLPFQLLLCTDTSLLTIKSGNESAKMVRFNICHKNKYAREQSSGSAWASLQLYPSVNDKETKQRIFLSITTWIMTC